jgi:uncharacterized protein (DUF302 family)
MRPEKGRQVAADRSQGSGKHIISACVMLLCNLLISVQVHAGTLLMARSTEQAEVSMSVLQDALKGYDYTIAHVQKCDGGMEEFDYKTDYYRVVFFGKIEEVRPIIDKHPEMAAYLPLKITVFAENKESVVVTVDPLQLSAFFNDAELNIQFVRWHNDLRAILDEVRNFKKTPELK